MGNIYYGVNQDNLDPRNKLIHGYLTGENEDWKKGTGIDIDYGDDVVDKYGLEVGNLIDNEKDDLNSFFGFNDLEGLTVAFIKQWASENPTEPITQEVIKECKNLARDTIFLKSTDATNSRDFSKLITNIRQNPTDYSKYNMNSIYTDLITNNVPHPNSYILKSKNINPEDLYILNSINKENVEGMKRTNIRLKEEAIKNSPEETAKKEREKEIKKLQALKNYYSRQGYIDGFYKAHPEAKDYMDVLK